MKLRAALLFASLMGIAGIANAAGEIVIKFSHAGMPRVRLDIIHYRSPFITRLTVE